jgi:methionine-rich copper-binding protein CopC
MRAIIAALAILALAAPAAGAHAFLDHAVPSVGNAVATPPPTIRLWFTQELEPAFSTVEVRDASGNRVDGGDAAVDAGDATILHASLKPLPPGTYHVAWRVLSVDTHTTEGTFTFTVGR